MWGHPQPHEGDRGGTHGRGLPSGPHRSPSPGSAKSPWASPVDRISLRQAGGPELKQDSGPTRISHPRRRPYCSPGTGALQTRDAQPRHPDITHPPADAWSRPPPDTCSRPPPSAWLPLPRAEASFSAPPRGPVCSGFQPPRAWLTEAHHLPLHFLSQEPPRDSPVTDIRGISYSLTTIQQHNKRDPSALRGAFLAISSGKWENQVPVHCLSHNVVFSKPRSNNTFYTSSSTWMWLYLRP